MADNKRIVLAYSGGLDTSVAISYLKERTGKDVVAVSLDVGQGGESLETIKQRALACGAVESYVVDARDEFANEYCMKALKANAMYEGVYPLVSAISRPLISKHLVRAAHQFGADTISHGCTGKGNDQVRFELTVKALAPHLKIIAPWRIWDIKSREDAVDYAEAHGIEIPVTKKDLYSRDRNIWHISHEGMDLEDPANEPQLDTLLKLGVSPEAAPDEAHYITIKFEKGVPTELDGEKLSPRALLEKLNELGGKYGVGIADIVEDRLVGMKSRGVYETPGGTILYTALNELEYLCLDRDTQAFKRSAAIKFAELVYDGKWFTPLREALSAMVDSMEETVTGEVRVKLYKGSVTPAGAKSPYSLYNEEIASFGDSHELYSHKDAEGFINLFGLPLKVRAMMQKKNEDK